MTSPDPRLANIERLLSQGHSLLAEIGQGVPALRRPPRKRRRFSNEAILAALAEGHVANRSAADRDPRLPERKALNRRRKADPSFDAQVRELIAARVPTRAMSAVEGASDWGQRLPGTQYDWDEIAAKIEAGATVGPASPNRQGLPSHTLIMARRKADPVFAARVHKVLVGRFGRNTRKKYDHQAILERIRCGAVMKGYPPAPGMPPRTWIERERHEDPAFDKEVREAIKEARRRRLNRRRLATSSGTAAWVAAQSAVPRQIPDPTRADIVGELSLLICEGIVGVDGDLSAAWKRCRTKLNRDQWKEFSLNDTIPGTDGLTRIDMVSDETPHF